MDPVIRPKFQRAVHAIAYLFILLFTLAAILVSLHRFWQYDVFFYDFGIFDQAIWKVSRFRPPVIDHLAVGGKLIFADHASPSMFLLAPLYWITRRSEALLIAQAVSVGASALVLYRIGLVLTAQPIQALFASVAYLLFIGLQNAIIADIHEVTVMALPLMLTFWALVREKKFLYLLFLLITLGFKESTFLVGAGVGILVLVTKPRWRAIGLLTIVLSITWGILAIRVIIPAASGGSFSYQPPLPQGIGHTLAAFFDPAVKRRTLLVSLGSFAFLPLLAPAYWLLMLGDIATRFLPTNTPLRWDLGLHYSAALAPILAVATLASLAWLARLGLSARLCTLVAVAGIANALVLHQFILRGPLGLAYNPAFYRHTKNFEFLDRLVAQVPSDASVMAQNNLAVRFTHQNVFLLRDTYDDYAPDYIVLDLREGQNPNNFFGVTHLDQLVAQLSRDPKYRVVYQTQKQFVYKRE